jgi:hypothetical protein
LLFAPSSLLFVIPVLVTGIQPPRVCAVNDSLLEMDLRAMDMALLDSCDILGSSPRTGIVREEEATAQTATQRMPPCHPRRPATSLVTECRVT